MKFLKDIVTGADNETHDIGRWSWIVSLFGVIGVVCFNIYHGAIVDVLNMSQALGAVVLAHGGALFAKSKTEPVEK